MPSVPGGAWNSITHFCTHIANLMISFIAGEHFVSSCGIKESKSLGCFSRLLVPLLSLLFLPQHSRWKLWKYDARRVWQHIARWLWSSTLRYFVSGFMMLVVVLFGCFILRYLQRKTFRSFFSVYTDTTQEGMLFQLSAFGCLRKAFRKCCTECNVWS